MEKEEAKKLVSEGLRKALEGTIGGDREGISARAAEALEGMTFEVHEEPDNVKLIREVMEEPLDVLHATVTVRFPGRLKRVYLEIPELDLLGPTSSVGDPSAESTAFETNTDPTFVDGDVLRNELMPALAASDKAKRADSTSVDGESEAPVHE